MNDNQNETPAEDAGAVLSFHEWQLRKLASDEWFVVISAVLSVIGSFLPWAAADFFGLTLTINGTDADGVITLICGGISMALILMAAGNADARLLMWLRVGLLLAGLAIFLVAFINIIDVGTTSLVSPRVGLFIVLVGGIAQTLFAGVLVAKSRGEGTLLVAVSRALTGRGTGGAVGEAAIDGGESANNVGSEKSGESPGASAYSDKGGLGLGTDGAPGTVAGRVQRGLRSTGSQFTITVNGSTLLKAGAAVMVLSALLSWEPRGEDAFPNVAGANPLSPGGVGLAVFGIGLSLLLRSWPGGFALGQALGSFALTLVYLSAFDPSARGAGTWLGLVGTTAAIAGAGLLVATESRSGHAGASSRLLNAAVGAVLATVASFWLDWAYGNSGLDPDAPFGIPVLILGAVALVVCAGVFNAPAKSMPRLALPMLQTAGTAISVIAGANVLAALFSGSDWITFGSGPLVAFAGGILVAIGAHCPRTGRVLGPQQGEGSSE